MKSPSQNRSGSFRVGKQGKGELFEGNGELFEGKGRGIIGGKRERDLFERGKRKGNYLMGKKGNYLRGKGNI